MSSKLKFKSDEINQEETAILPPKTKPKIKKPNVAAPAQSKLYERDSSLKFTKKKSEIQKRKPNNKKKKYKPRRKVFGVSDGIAETKSLRRI